MAAEPVAVPRPSVGLDYFELMKPRVMVLLLITMVGAMVWAEGGLPPLWLLGAALLGMALTSGGASAINHALEPDLDIRMERTKERPVAAGRVAPRPAIVFGIVLTVLGVVVLTFLTGHPLAAVMALVGNLFYVLIYTLWLKRRTPLNIVIGGAAGAMPPLVGWAAVTGEIGWPALIMFGVIFLWTPPHFWALAIVKFDDYADAGVPMLPNVAGIRPATVQMIAYTVLLLLFSLLPLPLWWLGVTGEVLGWLYGLLALALGLRFLQFTLRLYRHDGDIDVARETFRFSLLYLAGIFFAMALDRVLLG